MLKSTFFRKVYDLETLEELEAHTDRRDEEYVVKEVLELEKDEYERFCSNFLRDVSWINPGNGGHEVIEGKRVMKAIKVVNKATGQALIVNPDNYNYARYIALEK